MEFAAAALTSIAEAGAAAGTAVTTAATGPAGVFGLANLLPGAATASSILAGGSTVLAVMNAQRAGEAKADALNMQARDADTQTQIEALQGADRRRSLKAQFVEAIGARDVATAASGTDLSFGTPAIARRQAVTDAENAVTADADATDMRIARLRQRAANYRIQSAQASAGGLGQAAALAIEGGAKILKRY